MVSKPQNQPTRRRDPRTSGHLLEPEGSAARARWGPMAGPLGAPGAKKIIFSKVVPRPLGMLKHVFLAHLEPVVTRFGRWKIPKCLENGLFWDKTGSKMAQKHIFSKSDPGRIGMLKQVISANFEPVQASKQALLLSVLAIAPPHRSWLYSTLAILKPRWCPCQIQILSQKLTSGALGRGRQVGKCPPKAAHFVPQNHVFSPKTVPNLT